MEDRDKVRKCIRIVCVAGAVYLIFRCLLPLTAPFLFAWLTALVLKPTASAVAGRLRFPFRGRTYGVSPGVAGVLELCGIMVAAGTIVYFGGRRLYQEMTLLASRLPWWTQQLDRYLTGACRKVEGALSLEPDAMVCIVRDMIRSLGDTLKQGIMPYLMGNTVRIAGFCIDFLIVAVLYFVGVMLFLQEMDGWKEKMERSVYRQEFARIIRLLRRAADAYLKTQGVIMVLTTMVCMAGFFFLGNPYYILAAVGIGLLDALPVFGTGTVLIPWAVFCFLGGRWGRGLAVIGIYVACYFLREILEARLMGNRVGLTPLETLASIYTGLQLFGLLGFLLGPVGLLIVKEFGGEREQLDF